MGNTGRLCDWVKYFLLNRMIQVRIGNTYKIYAIENGTPKVTYAVQYCLISYIFSN